MCIYHWRGLNLSDMNKKDIAVSHSQYASILSKSFFEMVAGLVHLVDFPNAKKTLQTYTHIFER